MNANINKDQLIEEKVKSLILENQVSDLQNTLSDTISFFSMALGIGAILFTLLIAIASWWLNHLFNKKLIKLETTEQEAKNNLLDSKRILGEVNQKYDEITRINNSIISLKNKVDEILENQQGNRSWMKFLEEKIKTQNYSLKFVLLILEIEEKLKKVTVKDIENFYVNEDEGTPDSQFEYQKSYYIEAKEEFLKIIDNSYDIENYLEDISGDYETQSENVLSKLKEAEGFLEELNKIIKNNI